MECHERICADPSVRFGAPCVKGTRMSVADVLGLLAQGESVEAISEQFPQLTRDDVLACLAFAADRERSARPDSAA